MADQRLLEEALLTLQEELDRFRELQPKLAEVKGQAESIVAECRAATEEAQRTAREAWAGAVHETQDLYGNLSERNAHQFEQLRAAWEKSILATESTIKASSQIAGKMAALTSEVGTLADKVQEVAKGISEVNFPLRMDKLDATIAASLASVQGLQAKFDQLDSSVGNRLRNLQLEMERKLADVSAASEARLIERSDLIVAQMTSTSECIEEAFRGLQTNIDDLHKATIKEMQANGEEIKQNVRRIGIWTSVLLGMTILGISALLFLLISWHT